MPAGLVESVTAAPRANSRQQTGFRLLASMDISALFRKTNAITFLLACLALSGCGKPSDPNPPTFLGGTNYAAVATNSPMAGVPQAGILTLYHYPEGPKGPRNFIWPFITADDQAVFGKLIVFNGGLADDITWKYYPALLAYAGDGLVVEISMPAARHIPGFKPDWVNYAFSVLPPKNGIARFDVSQRPPVDEKRPKRLEVDLDVNEILKAVKAAQTNGEFFNFNGVKYVVAP